MGDESICAHIEFSPVQVMKPSVGPQNAPTNFFNITVIPERLHDRWISVIGNPELVKS